MDRNDRAPHGGRNDDDVQRYADRLAHLATEKHDIEEAIRELCLEARQHGVHVQALKEVVRRRFESAEAREVRVEREAAIERYLAALGMLADLPLGEAALERARTA